MYLRELRVTGFRAFEDARLEFPETGIVVVAGANNAGKSALLSALDIVAGLGFDQGVPVRHAGSEGEVSVVGKFALSLDERKAFLDEILGDAPNVFGPDVMAHIEIVFGRWPERAVFGLSEVRGEWPGHGMISLVKTVLSQNTSETGQVLRRIWVRGETQGSPGQLAPFLPHSNFRANLLSDIPPGEVGLAVIVDMLNQWRTRYYHFKALRPGASRIMQMSSTSTLEPTGNNLPAVLLHLLTNRRAVFAQLSEIIQEIIPEVGQLTTPTSANMIEVCFEDPVLPTFQHNLKDLGTGVEQLLLTVAAGLTQTSPFTLVLEEPETNLHPAAQRALLGLLQGWAKDRLIVVATHSPVMLDWSSEVNQLWHVTRQAGASTVHRVESDQAELFRALGARLSDVLSADRILILEGVSDEDVFGVWFPQVLRNPRVAVVIGGGGDNARHADLLSRWLSQADRLSPRKVLYMRDRDELSENSLDELRASRAVYVLERRELENYLLDPVAINMVLAGLASEATDLPSPEEISRAMEEEAEKLRPRVRANLVARRLQAVNLMDHSLRRKLATSGASAEAIANEVVSRIPEESEVRAQIDDWWAAANELMGSWTGKELLDRVPGEELLDRIFVRYANGRRFKKRRDGVLIAEAIGDPPAELEGILNRFMSDDEPPT